MGSDSTSASDSQLAHGDEYAYSQDSFVEFYDMMVASLPGADVMLYQQVLSKFLNAVAVDIATGSGRVLEALCKVDCKRLVGVDHSEAMLNACRKRIGTDDPRLTLLCQSMQV